MGRQVNFWMLEQDAHEFAQFVLSEPGVVMIGRLSSDRELHTLSELPCPPERWWWALKFWNQGFPMEPKWVQIREGPDKDLFAFVPRDEDPVIEFDRSILRESGELSQGRIWTGCRDEAFLRWYERIARWIRRRYKRIHEWEAWAAYAGPQACEWHQGGGVLGR